MTFHRNVFAGERVQVRHFHDAGPRQDQRKPGGTWVWDHGRRRRDPRCRRLYGLRGDTAPPRRTTSASNAGTLRALRLPLPPTSYSGLGRRPEHGLDRLSSAREQSRLRHGCRGRPRNVLFDRVRVHDQNGDIGRAFSNCPSVAFRSHVRRLDDPGLVLRADVVYHIQLQNFSGPPPTNVLIQNSSFSCPVDFLALSHAARLRRTAGDPLNTSSPGVTMKLVDNLSANGGAQGTVRLLHAVRSFRRHRDRHRNLPQSLIAPLLANVPGRPFPGGDSGLPLPPDHH